MSNYPSVSVPGDDVFVRTPAEARIMARDARHPAVVELLRFFQYEHLPEHLKAVSRPLSLLAHELANEHGLEGAELTTGLRKLLEAKDCFVRAALR